MTYVKIFSEYLTHKSPKETEDDLSQVLQALGEVEGILSTALPRLETYLGLLASSDWNKYR